MYARVRLYNQSLSTLRNYSRSLAKMALYFNQCPTLETDVRIKSYLIILRDIHQSSYTSFKFCIYGLRYAFRSIGQDDRIIKLPSIKRSRKLPVILSKREVRLLLKTPPFLKQRILFATVYSCGLRLSEVVRLKQSDICFDRMTVHICESKYKKERVVPLSKFLKVGLKNYYAQYKPKVYVFNGKKEGSPLSSKAIYNSFRNAIRNSGITKDIRLHSLRHSYATHLLESGLNVMSIQKLLGHSCITTTYEYLHVAQLEDQKSYSPLDDLYKK